MNKFGPANKVCLVGLVFAKIMESMKGLPPLTKEELADMPTEAEQLQWEADLEMEGQHGFDPAMPGDVFYDEDQQP